MINAAILLIVQIILLIISIKSKDNKNWLEFFSCNIASILAVIIVISYQFSYTSIGWFSQLVQGAYIIYCFWSIVIYVAILLIGLIIKSFRTQKNKNITIEKIDNVRKRKIILLPFILILSLTILSIGTDTLSRKNGEKKLCLERANDFEKVRLEFEEVIEIANRYKQETGDSVTSFDSIDNEISLTNREIESLETVKEFPECNGEPLYWIDFRDENIEFQIDATGYYIYYLKEDNEENYNKMKEEYNNYDCDIIIKLSDHWYEIYSSVY